MLSCLHSTAKAVLHDLHCTLVHNTCTTAPVAVDVVAHANLVAGTETGAA